MTTQETIDLYVQAVDLAKEKEGIGNQEKLVLNRFKILLRSGAVSDADSEMAQIGKVRKKTLLSIRELAESIFEDWVRKLNVIKVGVIGALMMVRRVRQLGGPTLKYVSAMFGGDAGEAGGIGVYSEWV